MTKWHTVPAEFRADRIFVRPITVEGIELRLLTDSGGGNVFLRSEAVASRGWQISLEKLDGGTQEVVSCPPFRRDAWIPPTGDFRIVQDSDSTTDLLGDADGFLGQSWHADRVWRFDYLHGTLSVWNGTNAPSQSADAAVPLGFQSDGEGNRLNAFPRIQASVDGGTSDFLLDTGATVHLSDAALSVIGGAPVQGTSFIVRSIFDRWRERHPDWRVIEEADTYANEAMIEVPEVALGPCTVGPVWFTRRADSNFHTYMSQWMDRTVDGALGGSIWKHLRIVLDYTRSVAYIDTVSTPLRRHMG